MSSIFFSRIASLHKFCFVLNVFTFALAVQFSMINLRFRFFVRQLIYYTTILSVCQYLFQKFFAFFQSFFIPFRILGCRFSATYILYHKAFRLSIPFSKVFYIFSKSFSNLFFCGAVSRTAYILYHFPFVLSSTFFDFFHLWFLCHCIQF